MDNFIECETLEQANMVDLTVYRFVTYSDRRGIYIFTKRLRKIPDGYLEKTGISKRSTLRSMTPKGFAKAFYEANK